MIVIIYIYTHTHAHIFLHSFQLWFITGYWIQFPVLYSRILLFIHPIYHSLHLLIPNSHSIQPPAPLSLSLIFTCIAFNTCLPDWLLPHSTLEVVDKMFFLDFWGLLTPSANFFYRRLVAVWASVSDPCWHKVLLFLPVSYQSQKWYHIVLIVSFIIKKGRTKKKQNGHLVHLIEF